MDTLNMRRLKIAWLLFLVLFLFSSATLGQSSYTLFESGQVRPLALSPDGKHLFAVNTPDNRLEMFAVKDGGLVAKGSVQVGLEPVAVAIKSNHEVWVVNNVSDSISIVSVGHRGRMKVKQTLLVGDEPSDIVFAGDEDDKRAFITTAHRGQNSPINPQLTTPGVGRADVWVFDADEPGKKSLGGTPETIITLFTDTPRALAVSADGKKVYAAGFKTGNQTTVITEVNVSANGGVPGADLLVDTNGDGVPEPHTTDTAGNLQPLTGLIVKFDGQHWVDELGRIWDDQIKFNLPDKDVFVIDATANPPVQLEGDNGVYTGVGTILYNMAVNPVSGKVYVSNTEALNQRRFTGPGGKGQTIKGHFAESRITVLGDNVKPVHLNKHIDYSACCDGLPNSVNDRSLALPMDMVVSKDGTTLYVAAFGSNKVGVFDTRELEDDTFVPDVANQVTLSAGGPSGVALDERRDRLYVMTRYDNGISIVDTNTKSEVGHVTMYSPEPQHIVDGRQYLYDASLTSSHGDSSCALCHVFGDMDQLSWDLGNPDADVVLNPGPLAINHEDFGLPVNPHFAPLKGPMSTQSMTGLANHGPMHWRGDQTGGNEEPNIQPDSGIYNERLGFSKFNGAFVDLQGRSTPLPEQDMDEFTDFTLELMYPPNPVRALDNSLTPDQQAGFDFFFDPNMVVDTAFHCNGCHLVDRNGNAEFGVDKPGFFGTDGRNTFAFIQQFMKIPHLRNQYQKVGMFGMPNNGKFLADDPFTGLSPDMTFNEFFFHVFFGNENQHLGDQIKGFGYTHDGSADTIFRFHNIIGFLPRPPGTVTPLDPGNGFNLDITPEAMIVRRQLEQYLLVFENNFFPILGQQVTLTDKNRDQANPRIDLLMARASLGECDLVARKGKKGYLYQNDGTFKTSRSDRGPVTDARLRRKAEYQAVTYTCVPPGNGMRIALDRDEDGYLDGDERRAGSDPADPASTP